MRTRSLNFWELHVEKLLLGLTGVFLAVMLWVFLVNSPNNVTYERRELGPRELNRAILNDAQALWQRIERAPAQASAVPDYSDLVVRLHKGSLFDRVPAGNVAVGLPLPGTLQPTVRFGKPIDKLDLNPPAKVTLVAPLPPTDLCARTGRSVVVPARPTGSDRMTATPVGREQPEPRDMSWVTVFARFDPEAQEHRMAPTYTPRYAEAYIAQMDVQRQELLADDQWSAWADVGVDRHEPLDGLVPLFRAASGVLANRTQIEQAFDQIRQTELSRTQPPFYEVLAGDQWQPPTGQPSEDGEKLPIWFHDSTAQPGKTYRYRMRVGLWNPYVGRPKALKDPAQAEHCVLLSDWSLPGPPVTVTPETYFFLLGSRRDTQTASVEVWRWHAGTWLRKTFTATVGDVIGGVRSVKVDTVQGDGESAYRPVDFTTGAVVLDLRFDEPAREFTSVGGSDHLLADKTTLVMAYLDPISGRVCQKVQAFDRFDPIRKLLRDSHQTRPAKTPVYEPVDGQPVPRPGRGQSSRIVPQP